MHHQHTTTRASIPTSACEEECSQGDDMTQAQHITNTTNSTEQNGTAYQNTVQ